MEEEVWGGENKEKSGLKKICQYYPGESIWMIEMRKFRRMSRER
jgi:hypothetical protein